MDDLTRLAWTRTDPDRPGRTQTDLAGFRWVPLGSAGFRWIPLGSARSGQVWPGANLQLVAGRHTLAALSPKTFGLFY